MTSMLDMDHFGNPNAKPTKRELEEAHDEDVAFNAIHHTLGAISYCTAKELQEIVAEAQAHVDGPTFTGKPARPSVLDTQHSALDVQQSGTHYKGCAIQPVEYIHANNLGFMEGNVIKYITRHKAKNGADDIRKVIHYCQLLLELEYHER